MSGQEQLKLNKNKPASAGGDETGNEDLRARLPNIGQIKVKRVRYYQESKCSDDAGSCEWSNICGFNDCPRRIR